MSPKEPDPIFRPSLYLLPTRSSISADSDNLEGIKSPWLIVVDHGIALIQTTWLFSKRFLGFLHKVKELFDSLWLFDYLHSVLEIKSTCIFSEKVSLFHEFFLVVFQFEEVRRPSEIECQEFSQTKTDSSVVPKLVVQYLIFTPYPDVAKEGHCFKNVVQIQLLDPIGRKPSYVPLVRL